MSETWIFTEEMKKYGLTTEKLDVLWDAREILRDIYVPHKYDDDVESYAASAAACITCMMKEF